LLYIDGLELASGGEKDRQVPFTRIAEKQSAFIASKYLPRGLRLDDPRAMKRVDIIKLFEHIGSRQASHGVKDAFRYKQYLSTRKKGDFRAANYLDRIIDTPASPDVPELALAETIIQQAPAQSVNTFPSGYTFTEPATTQEPATTSGPELFFDPDFFWDRPGILESSLEPLFNRPVVNNSDSSLILPTPGPTSTSLTPIPAGAPSSHQITPRRRGKNADTLAIEEAASFISPTPRRSGRNADPSNKRTGRR
jgi:hypothetical protein